uniref:V-type proton ATPase subunit C n=1 Tax=Periophthalmus magnuspinnatus TaxID=409849 RepID=A0A3B4BCM6_9GOBI
MGLPIISTPITHNCRSTWTTKLSHSTSPELVSINHKFSATQGFAGFLSVIVNLSNLLRRKNSNIRNIHNKVGMQHQKHFEDKKDKSQTVWLAPSNDLVIRGKRPQWDMFIAKIKHKLKSSSDVISVQCLQFDNFGNFITVTYSNFNKGQNQTKCKQNDTVVMIRQININYNSSFLLNQYLVCQLVSMGAVGYFVASKLYDTIIKLVCPTSGRVNLMEHAETLLGVRLFRTTIKFFEHKSKKTAFFVADLKYSKKEVEKSKQTVTKLSVNNNKQLTKLANWLNIELREMFIQGLKTKWLRVYYNNMRKYRLLGSFSSITLQPHSREIKKMNIVVHYVYKYLQKSIVAILINKINLPFVTISIQRQHPWVEYSVDNFKNIKP